MDFFEISWDSPGDGSRRGRLRGELDVAAAPVLERDVLEQLADPVDLVVIDLEGLEFLDSSGLRALLMVQEHAQRAGARLVLVPGPPRVQSLFHVAEVVSWFEFCGGTHGHEDGLAGSRT